MRVQIVDLLIKEVNNEPIESTNTLLILEKEHCSILKEKKENKNKCKDCGYKFWNDHHCNPDRISFYQQPLQVISIIYK